MTAQKYQWFIHSVIPHKQLQDKIDHTNSFMHKDEIPMDLNAFNKLQPVISSQNRWPTAFSAASRNPQSLSSPPTASARKGKWEGGR